MTLDVSQCSIPNNNAKTEHPENMDLISVTLEVFHPDKSSFRML